jgi:membrane protease subunit HflC
MRYVKIAVTVLVAIAAFVAWSSAYVVDETEQVVVTQFGDPVGEPLQKPGLYFKLPLVQTAHYFDDRFLEWNGDANEIPTKDKRFIEVDTYARWRIADPLTFYQRLGNERSAQSRLDDIIDGATRDAVASHELLELVRASNRDPAVDPKLKEKRKKLKKLEEEIGAEEAEPELKEIDVGRPKIMKLIEKKVVDNVEDLGIEVIDMRFKRINYNDQVRKKVYDRMIAERERIAELYRSEGRGQAAEIRGKKEKELDEIRSEAEKKAQKIRGEADGKVTDVYAKSYRQAPEFYQFLRTMETYSETIGPESRLLMSTDGEFFQYLREYRAPEGTGP